MNIYLFAKVYNSVYKLLPTIYITYYKRIIQIKYLKDYNFYNK